VIVIPGKGFSWQSLSSFWRRFSAEGAGVDSDSHAGALFESGTSIVII
jgi:hypothetical protein